MFCTGLRSSVPGQKRTRTNALSGVCQLFVMYLRPCVHVNMCILSDCVFDHSSDEEYQPNPSKKSKQLPTVPTKSNIIPCKSSGAALCQFSSSSSKLVEGKS